MLKKAKFNFQLDGGIIAGGLGRRLSGVDKGLLIWKGESFASHIAQRFRPYIDKLIINCNRNHPEYKAIADKVVVDQHPQFLGPLAGLQSLLMASTADYLLISPCDTPALPADFAPRMLSCLDDAMGKMVAVTDGEREHPLHLLIPTSLATDIADYLARGERKMMHWIVSHDPLWCDFSDEKSSFLNVNTQKDQQHLNQMKN